MATSETRSVRRSPIIQFSVFSENKVGILSEIIGLLAGDQVHVMALSTVDTIDSSILRVVVDDPDRARALFAAKGLACNESEVLGVEMATEADLGKVLSALLEAELNIHYLYPFVSRPRGRCGIVLHLEDQELAADALSLRGIRVIDQRDISR
ncbi:MAG: acetolactate synthase [Opitutaceae bacterium]